MEYPRRGRGVAATNPRLNHTAQRRGSNLRDDGTLEGTTPVLDDFCSVGMLAASSRSGVATAAGPKGRVAIEVVSRRPGPKDTSRFYSAVVQCACALRQVVVRMHRMPTHPSGKRHCAPGVKHASSETQQTVALVEQPQHSGDAYLRRAPVSTDYPRRSRGVAATRLHGLSTRQPRRRRDFY